MKSLLFVVLSFAAAAVFADGFENVAAAPAKKADAKTNPSPKGDKAKAAAPKAPAKKAGFQAYDGGEWKPVDNRKGYIYGYRLTDGDLVGQPVLICKFDPDAVVEQGEKRLEDPRYIGNFLGFEVKVQPYLQVVNVPSRPLTKDELLTVGKKAPTTAAVAGFPWYADVGLVNEPANPSGRYPFYYVVDAEGKVVYAGDRGQQAQQVVYSALKKCGEPHPMLGFVKPEIHADLCSTLEFGKDTSKVVQKLKPIALKGSGDAKEEADKILKALDRAKTYAIKTILMFVNSEPQQSVIVAEQAAKTFPRDKQAIADAVMKAQKNPVVAQSLKTFKNLLAIQEKLKEAETKGTPMKKADLKKNYQLALNGERMCAKARKEYGEKLPRAFLTLENLVQVVKAELEAAGAN